MDFQKTDAAFEALDISDALFNDWMEAQKNAWDEAKETVEYCRNEIKRLQLKVEVLQGFLDKQWKPICDAPKNRLLLGWVNAEILHNGKLDMGQPELCWWDHDVSRFVCKGFSASRVFQITKYMEIPWY